MGPVRRAVRRQRRSRAAACRPGRLSRRPAAVARPARRHRRARHARLQRRCRFSRHRTSTAISFSRRAKCAPTRTAATSSSPSTAGAGRPSSPPRARPGRSAATCSRDLPRQLRALWEPVRRGDRAVRVLFLNDRAGIYALGYPLPRPVDHLVALAEIVTLGGCRLRVCCSSRSRPSRARRTAPTGRGAVARDPRQLLPQAVPRVRGGGRRARARAGVADPRLRGR